jgi:hypothetical protein
MNGGASGPQTTSGAAAALTTRAIGDRWRLAWLLARHGGKRVRDVLAAPLHRLSRSGGGTAERPVTEDIPVLAACDALMDEATWL